MIEIDEVWDAIKQTSELPASLAKVDALESLTRQAIQLNGFLVAFMGQLHTINACNGTVLPERMLAAYTAMRANFEQHGHEWSDNFAKQMTRAGAFVIGFVDSFPEVPRAQLDALFADQEQMHAARGESIYKLLESRVWLELEAGRLDRARELYDRLVATPVPEAWCPPCRINQRVSILTRLERNDEAIELAAPLLDGRRKCDTVPRSTWATLLVPLARCGDWDRSRDYYARAHRASMSETRWLGTAAKVLTYAAVDGSFTKAKNLFERCLPHALEPTSKDSIRDFFIAAMVFFEAIGRDRATLTLATPATFPLHKSKGHYEVTALREWFEAAARTLSLAFDRRNGNDFHANRLAAACEVLAIARRAA